MLEFIEAKIGRWAVLSGAAVVVALLLVLHFTCHQRQPGSPRRPVAGLPLVAGTPAPMGPTPPAASALAQAAAATSTHVHIVIRHWPQQWAAPGPGGGRQLQAGGPAPDNTGSGSVAATIATEPPPIEIDVTTSSTASSTAAATASAPSQVAGVSPTQLPVPSHGRIGVLAATIPGILSVDVEALQLRTPWWLVGQPLEVGLDAEANLAEAGAGISVGSKAFIEGGGYLGYSLRQRGVYVGAGLRF